MCNTINEIVKLSEMWKEINATILMKLIKKQYTSFFYTAIHVSKQYQKVLQF